MDLRPQARVKGQVPIRKDQVLAVIGQRLVGQDFSGRKLLKFSSAGSRFESCKFEGMRIEDASLGGGQAMSEYLDCSFDRTRTRYMGGGYARFVRCSFRDVDLRDWRCFAVELVECTFSGRLRTAFFNGTVPPDEADAIGRAYNEFWGNDFSAMDLLDVDFRTGIDLSRQRLPSGPPYLYVADAADAVTRAYAQAVHWPDSELRRQAMVLLRIWEDQVAEGQRQFLLRADNYPRAARPAYEALSAILELRQSEEGA